MQTECPAFMQSVADGKLLHAAAGLAPMPTARCRCRWVCWTQWTGDGYALPASERLLSMRRMGSRSLVDSCVWLVVLRVAFTMVVSVAPDGLSMHPRCRRVTALVA